MENKEKKKKSGKKGKTGGFLQLLRKMEGPKRAVAIVCAALVVIGIGVTIYFVVSRNMPIASYPQLASLREHIFSDPDIVDEISDRLGESTVTSNFYVVFISICDMEERARVFTGTGSSVRRAWDEAERSAARFIQDNDYKLAWAKADIVDSMERVFIENLNNYVVSTVYQNFYRKGISLDREFNVAFLEAEISGNKLLNYYTESEVYADDVDYNANLLHSQNINFYLSRWREQPQITSFPRQIVTFTTVGFFADENSRVYELYNEGMYTGRRREWVDDKYMEPLVISASEYLYDLIQPDGQFIYGYFPVFDNWMTGYNILRHASSLWSLVNLYRMTGDSSYIEGIDRGLDYLVESIAYKDPDTAFVIEHKADEVKLGGNGLAIIAMTEYMDVFGTDKYMELVTHLANGILQMQHDDGSWYHVWNYPDFSQKEEYRTVYYDGEATFALVRAYTFTGDERFLDAGARSVEYFIDNDYTRYRDHWVAYSMHEITKYIPDARYYEFALRNVSNNIDRIYNQPTSYHTYLELLAISWQTYQRLIESDVDVAYLDEFDVEYFAQALYRRAEYMLNSFFFPEYAMYMRVPKDALGTFFVRHDSFRVRIDDIQHFIGGYYYLLQNWDSVSAYLSDEFLEFVHQGNVGRFDAEFIGDEVED